MKLDDIDIKIISTLVNDGRASVESVADRVGLSSTPVRRRIQRLEDEQVISGYRADIDSARAGLEIRIHVLIKLKTRDRSSIEQFEKIVHDTPEIQYCDLVTGPYDYFLLLHLPSMNDYHRYLRRFLDNNDAIGSIESNVVIGKIKHSPMLALTTTR